MLWRVRDRKAMQCFRADNVSILYQAKVLSGIVLLGAKMLRQPLDFLRGWNCVSSVFLRPCKVQAQRRCKYARNCKNTIERGHCCQETGSKAPFDVLVSNWLPHWMKFCRSCSVLLLSLPKIIESYQANIQYRIQRVRSLVSFQQSAVFHNHGVHKKRPGKSIGRSRPYV